MDSEIVDEIFPNSTATTAVPCGTASCIPTTIQIIARDRGVINQTASDAALESLRNDVNRSLAAVEASAITTIDNSIFLLAVNIYIPIFLILIIVIWVLCAAGLIGATAAIVLTILLIIIAVIFIFLIRASISSYLTQQLDVIRQALTDYVLSEDFINALNSAACVYNSIAGGIPPTLSIRNCSSCKVTRSSQQSSATVSTSTQYDLLPTAFIFEYDPKVDVFF
ncbi:Hypothetical protein POVR1_LOCUS599 [uncultured virus]|nr:Hypothetical protein POVR1_LOCUS599 [uncultured virus]